MKKFKIICLIKIIKKNGLLFAYSLKYSLFLFSIIFYVVSLKGCYGFIKVCPSHEKVVEYYTLGLLLVISSFWYISIINLLLKSICFENLICLNFFFQYFILLKELIL